MNHFGLGIDLCRLQRLLKKLHGSIYILANHDLRHTGPVEREGWGVIRFPPTVLEIIRSD